MPVHRSCVVLSLLLLLALPAAAQQPVPVAPAPLPQAAGRSSVLPAEPLGTGPDVLPAGGTRATTSYTVGRASGYVQVDGVLSDAGWADATLIELAYEYLPGDNAEPPVRTECRVTYDAQNLYLGCTAFDPQPERIRANYTDRDRALQDDHIVLLLDPFNDQRRSFQFRINPLGVQMDAIFAEGFEDFSWDAIWASAGRITEEGYVVEAAIPFKSLRFPRSAAAQTWGIILERSYPRSARHRISSVPRDRSNACMLCQAGRLSGFQGIAPGQDLELSPTLTASRIDRRNGLPGGDLVSGDGRAEPGLNARWGISPNVSLNATVNPDFSQVEADAAQLTVNERFAVSFPEKRPFFLEGADLFQTLTPTVVTRTIIDPRGGFKITAKEGRNALGAFVTRDRTNRLLFPANQRSREVLLDEEVTTAVARYRRDVGQSSTVGLLYTGRNGEGYQNHVGGVDALLRLSQTNTFRAQLQHSLTEYPDTVVRAFQQPEGTFGGAAFIGQFSHNSRNWNASAQFQELGGGFRADAGLMPRMDVRMLRGNAQRVVWGRPGGWYNRLALNAIAERLTMRDGTLTDRGLVLNANYQGARQSELTWLVAHNRRLYNGQLFDLLDTRWVASIRPSGSVALRASGRHGAEIDIWNTRRADILQLAPGIDLRLGRHLNAELNHTLQRLSTPQGEQIFEANLTQARLVYNFNARTYVRGTLQYQDLRRDPALYARPVKPEEQNVSTQLLFSYMVNPQTVLFLGYADAHRGEREFDLVQENRTFFLKLGYAWRL
jgi:hypothetical protein